MCHCGTSRWQALAEICGIEEPRSCIEMSAGRLLSHWRELAELWVLGIRHSLVVVDEHEVRHVGAVG